MLTGVHPSADVVKDMLTWEVGGLEGLDVGCRRRQRFESKEGYDEVQSKPWLMLNSPKLWATETGAVSWE